MSYQKPNKTKSRFWREFCAWLIMVFFFSVVCFDGFHFTTTQSVSKDTYFDLSHKAFSFCSFHSFFFLKCNKHRNCPTIRLTSSVFSRFRLLLLIWSSLISSLFPLPANSLFLFSISSSSLSPYSLLHISSFSFLSFSSSSSPFPPCLSHFLFLHLHISSFSF